MSDFSEPGVPMDDSDHRAPGVTANKSEVIARIMSAWNLLPGLRLGQMINNALEEAEGLPNLFYLADEDLAQAVSDYAARYKH